MKYCSIHKSLTTANYNRKNHSFSPKSFVNYHYVDTSILCDCGPGWLTGRCISVAHDDHGEWFLTTDCQTPVSGSLHATLSLHWLHHAGLTTSKEDYFRPEDEGMDCVHLISWIAGIHHCLRFHFSDNEMKCTSSVLRYELMSINSFKLRELKIRNNTCSLYFISRKCTFPTYI